MNTDEREHMATLRREHWKRLCVLEVQAAKQGSETPASIRIEIEELREVIAEIDGKLHTTVAPSLVSTIPVAVQYESVNDVRRQKVEIVFRGQFESLTPELQNATIRALAALVNIPTEQITVLRVAPGSIVFQLEMPHVAAQSLLRLFIKNDPMMAELDIEDVRIVEMSADQRDEIHRNIALISQAMEMAGSSRFGEAQNLSDLYRELGDLHRELGEHQQAIRDYLRARALARDVGNRFGECTIGERLGSLFVVIGRLRDAATLFEQAILIAHELGDWQYERATLLKLGDVYRLLGHQDEAFNTLDLSEQHSAKALVGWLDLLRSRTRSPEYRAFIAILDSEPPAERPDAG